ncbi:MAG: excinuclease ABC subunit A [Candidatus Omnitrophica bacterium CG11_big_fil_rev_8_21_14_0_20_45_26]|uniref:UvrABC system protein A n=1 Tax=Candidatus Abzuiibacterium crystallinum TaxID=1974748 RepID=A0A2H0LMU8_9BACT|nr:MAG: excinuclease ABC subunit A [Candidatus Omnitrophica bacterium CG11_big_fil_rev_8_21_14_0_20_45_26]PIW65233.1 MAG: excinuclease ABC subunit UvrA [Candidatus Omnitrophica bacterium CG12_big_fil_rev_8_21_14_0_65_45_16]
MKTESKISIRGAREHNLKNLNLDLPRNQLIVITGLSGSGKSSLAFDTIYAEGQRRYLESMSSYARQFLERMKKPDVDHISGLSPSIAIEQKSLLHNPRSTVATVTEIYDYMRLLFAKVGSPHCHQCGASVSKQTPQEILERVRDIPAGMQLGIFAPLIRGRKGEYKKLILDVKKQGFTHIRLDGKLKDVHRDITMSRKKRHDIEVLIDTVEANEKHASRIQQSVETALRLTDGTCLISMVDASGKARRKELLFSQKMTCLKCDISYPEFTPNMFSFNSPYGACQKCRGIGKLSQAVTDYVIHDPTKALLKGAINEAIYFSFNRYVIEDLVYDLKEHFEFDLETPYQDLPAEVRDALFWGTDEVTGLIEELENLFYSTSSEEIKRKIRKFIREEICPACRGGRLKPESLGVQIEGKNIVEICRLSIDEASQLFQTIEFKESVRKISDSILKEIRERLRFLVNVGLGYLTLDRTVPTLAGGELQRIRLAAQIGVGLSGVLYVLDEPSIGLHPRDNEKLIRTLESLRDLRNTVIVIEHDEETMRRADFIVDIGPGAGEHGGLITGIGQMDQLNSHPESLTAQYLSGNLKIELPIKRKNYHRAKIIELKGCCEHNLKQIDVKIPLGCFVCITGVSGSGKSTLVHDILFKALHNQIWKTDYRTGQFKSIKNAHLVDKVIAIDQSPIGRTPRSNAATYTDLFTHIRKLFAQTPEAKLRSYSASRFSFNVSGGQCAKCRGEGFVRLEMSFLPDVYVQCDDCKGRRYNDQTLEVYYNGKNIAEVLNLSIEEAKDFFQAIPPVRDRLEILNEIGLSYLKLGQPSTTLSGGEAQRVKLASELGKKSTGQTLYILDEPTTGLHFADIQNLLHAFFRLREEGNTILIIEHNLDIVKMADYIIDLGPEGGSGGGQIIASGSPEELVTQPGYTSSYLKNYLNKVKLVSP